MTASEKARLAITALEEMYPSAECSLEYNNEAWRLVVMARLSAQCTDERVNLVCRQLFHVYPTVHSLASADISDIERIIKPCGLFRTKAQSIKAECTIIANDYNGRVPDTMDELLALPGVGRKIANLILGDIYKKGGIVADTHCIRISNRIGLAQKKEPLAVERALTPLIPNEKQSDFCHRLVHFGREICTARSPKCTICPLCANGACDGEQNK